MLARDLGYHAGLLSLKAMGNVTEQALIEHCRQVAQVMPIIGFYLQEAVGGRRLSYSFWRRLCEQVEGLAAVKMAPFNRYRTLDVVRAVADAGREDVALYTGNDDHILLDLLTPYRLQVRGQWVERRIVGGLLGQWAVWARPAAALLEQCHQIARSGQGAEDSMLALAEQLTDANAAVFDAANDFAGVIAGVHEVLRRQGLLEGIWCLDEHETLGPGQREELDRVSASYPHLIDDAFITEHRDVWLKG
jgi:dihydrodipicolinate synthase/N-acetylneuraminate lyase